MRIKTFHAKTMSAALQEIKSHLGPEALLLSTKEIPRRAGAWGGSSGFEVVAASDTADDGDVFSYSRKHELSDEKVSFSKQPNAEVFCTEVVPATYSPSGFVGRPPASSGKSASTNRIRSKPTEDANEEIDSKKDLPFKGRVSAGLYRDLVDCGVDEWLAREILLRGMADLTAGQRRSRPALIRSAAQAALTLIAAPDAKNGMPEKRVVALVGPTGVGKTTSIAKLAALLALKKKKKVVLMTLDGYRIGAIEQLRTYAGLMGIPFRFVGQVSELPRAIEENSQRDFILIDTAGHGPRDLETIRDLAVFLRQSDLVERHLVLSATTKPLDLQRLIDRFEICKPDHLLFTKLDETSTHGPILNELVRTHKSFSYYTNGQRVPDDLHAVFGERIIDIILYRNDSVPKESL